jgi:phosphohistidine swiveling domain-containing protein
MASLVEGLHEIGADDVARVGGKAANLGVLVRAGLPVPPGFCVTTPAYRGFVESHGLGRLISRAVEEADPADPASLEAASGAIRAGFAGCAVPPDTAGEVAAAHARLVAGRPAGHGRVAVRSSATAEDLPDLSFAGQQDTFLNVVGPDSVLDALVRCWASLWTARAIGYRIRNGVDDANVSMAVIVQSMVTAEAAGVLFTADPVTGRRTDTVIDATIGLGEALVSGAVEPDHYVVDQAAARIVSKVIGAKAVSARGLAEGGTELRRETAGDRQALPDEQILALARLGHRAADVFGSPQDLEWVWSGQDLSVVQSRPITSLYPLPADLPDRPVTALFAFAVWQGMLDPFTPLGQEVFAHLGAELGNAFGAPAGPTGQRVFLTAGERLFVNIGPLLRTARGRAVARAFLSAIDPPSVPVLDEVLEDERFAVRPVSARGLVPRLARFLAPLVANAVYNLVRPVRGRARIESRVEEALAAARAECERAQDLATLVPAIRRAVAGLPARMLPLLVAGVAAGQAPHQVLLRTVSGARDRELVMELSRGLPHNVTTQMDLDLWRAVVGIRSDAASAERLLEGGVEEVAEDYRRGQLPAVAQQALADFLARYGARGTGEIDIGRVRWGEDPSGLVDAVRAYLRIPEERSPQAVFDRGAERAEQARRALVDSFRRAPGGRVKSLAVDLGTRRFRVLGGLRETPKFFIVRLLGLFRASLLAAGEKLVEAGALDAPDDVMFLSLSELEVLARAGGDVDWKPLVAGRRERYARELCRPRSPRFLLSDGTTYYDSPRVTASRDDDPRVLRGSPVSAGSVTGLVRVVLDPKTARLAPGEIMVCRATDPAWTPLFLAAGGLVLEVGGMMTHGSVVAREYGIPAVVGVVEATRRLRTGQRIMVDGSSGTVRVLSDEPA